MADNDGGFFAYNSDLDAFTLYHIVQEDHGKRIGDGPALPALGHAIAGAVASALSKAVVYPIDTVVTRLQVQKGLKGDKEAESAASAADAEYTDPIDAARKIYKHEGGLRAFYTGLSSDVVKQIADSFLFFLAYTMAREQMLKRQGGKQLPVLKELSVGVVAGAVAKAITSPIQNIVVRQQTAALIAARDPTTSTSPAESDKLSVKDIALQIRNEKGLAGFWAGYSASVILTLNPAITFAVDNLLRSLVPRKYRENPNFVQTFLVAALSKVVATSITYPVMLAKSRQQAKPGSPNDTHIRKSDPNSSSTSSHLKHTLHKASRIFEAQTALFLSLRKIYRREGLSGLYSGLEGEVVKGFLQHGLTMMIKENVHVGIIHLYYMLLKLTKRWPEGLQQLRSDAGDVARDVGQRAENVGVSVAEGAKSLGRKAMGEEE